MTNLRWILGGAGMAVGGMFFGPPGAVFGGMVGKGFGDMLNGESPDVSDGFADSSSSEPSDVCPDSGFDNDFIDIDISQFFE